MLRVEVRSSTSIAIHLDAKAVAQAAHENAQDVRLCSAVEHFASSMSPSFQPLQHVRGTVLRPMQRKMRCCSVCGANSEDISICDRCKLAWCEPCMRPTALQHLSAHQRALCLSHKQVSAERLALGAWPSTDSRGRIFAWFLWTGDNPMPAYLQLCLDSFAHAAGERFCVRLVRPWHIAELLSGCVGCSSADGSSSRLHPAYEHLSLVHRADYLRCELMHRYGGLYADCDTICCSDLTHIVDALYESAAVLPDAALLHEAGMNVGLFRRGSELTRCWRDALRARLDLRLPELLQFRQEFPGSLHEDALEWNELLRDLVVPLVAAFVHLTRNRPAIDGSSSSSGSHNTWLDCGRSLRAHLWLPTRQQGFDPLVFGDELGGPMASSKSGCANSEGSGASKEGSEPSFETISSSVDVLVLTNNAYGGQLKALSREEFLHTRCVLSQWLKHANGLLLVSGP